MLYYLSVVRIFREERAPPSLYKNRMKMVSEFKKER